MRTLVLCLLLASSGANAYFFDETMIKEGLSYHGRDKFDNHTQRLLLTRAEGYVIAIADAYNGTAVCVPKDILSASLMDAAHAYMEAKQAEKKPAATAIVLALQQKWPCKSK